MRELATALAILLALATFEGIRGLAYAQQPLPVVGQVYLEDGDTCYDRGYEFMACDSGRKAWGPYFGELGRGITVSSQSEEHGAVTKIVGDVAQSGGECFRVDGRRSLRQSRFTGSAGNGLSPIGAKRVDHNHIIAPAQTGQAMRNVHFFIQRVDEAADRRHGRQRRLLAEMQTLKLDLVIVQQIEHVQWLTGARYPWTMSPAAALRADGHLTLVAPKKPILEAAADEVVNYEAQWHSTLRNDQRQASSQAEALTCSCQAQDGTQKMSRSFQSKRLPSMIE